MAGCPYVMKKNQADRTKDKLCNLVVQPGSKFCPRHTFLHNLNEVAARDKAIEARPKGMPQTRAELIERGYQFTGNANCYTCGNPIEWWKTPANRPMPWNPMLDIQSHAVSHFATCVHAAQHRRAS